MALGTTIFINIGVAPKNFTIHSNLPCVKPPTILTCILFFSFPSSELYDLEIPHFTKNIHELELLNNWDDRPKCVRYSEQDGGWGHMGAQHRSVTWDTAIPNVSGD